MAVFTAIASAIVGAIGISTATILGSLTWAGLATSIVAGGLAMATAKVLGVFKPPNMTSASDPGVKIQLPPATDNKLPIFYGRNITGSIIVDAGIKNQNNTMVYATCISEKTDSGTYTVQKIYRDDAELVFSGASVTSVIDPNSTSSTTVNGKMRCRVYAGGTAASNQIFPLSPQVAATTLLPTIDATTSYEDIVFAVFEMDYDPENGLTGLGAINFDIENSLSEPSAVLQDYLLNSRYGAGLSASDLDATSFADLQAHSEEQVAYTTSLGAADTHERYRVDGMLGTYGNVKDNIDVLCQTCSSFFTYNPKLGKFAVVPNRAATTAEKADAFTFTNDNIVGAISITSTDLYGLYNKIEVEYPSFAKKDQTDTVFVITPAGDRNANEPDNKLTTRYNLVNDNTRVENLANIDLRQSRTSTVVELTADYSAIQIDAGDVVKITNTEYAFNEKLFRCMRVTEKEDEAGMLTASVVLLEYADDIYTHTDVVSRGEPGVSLIPGWWTGLWGNVDYSNIANIVGNVTIVDDPTGGNANIIDSGNGNVVGNVGIGNANIIYGPGIGIGDPIINIPINIPNIPDIETICLNLANLNVEGFAQPGHFCHDIVPPNGGSTFPPNANVTVPIPLPEPPVVDPTNPNLPVSPNYEFDLDINFKGPLGVQTGIMNIPSIPVNYTGRLNRRADGPVQAGLQEDQVEANATMVDSATTPNTDLGQPNSLVNTPITVNLGGIDYGEFSAVNAMLPLGGLGAGGNELAYVSQRVISYKEMDIHPTTGKYTASANADIIDVQAGTGVIATFNNAIPPNLSDNFSYIIEKARANAIAINLPTPRPPISATKTYLANTMTIQHFANSDLSIPSGGQRGARVTNQDKRISKADNYLPLIPPGTIGPIP